MWALWRAAQQDFAKEFVADPLSGEAFVESSSQDPVVLRCGAHHLELNARGSALIHALIGATAKTWKASERMTRTADLHDSLPSKREVVSALTDHDGDVHRWAAYVLTHRRALHVERGDVAVPLTPRGARAVVALVYATAPQLVDLTPRLLGSTDHEPQAA